MKIGSMWGCVEAGRRTQRYPESVMFLNMLCMDAFVCNLFVRAKIVLHVC